MKSINVCKASPIFLILAVCVPAYVFMHAAAAQTASSDNGEKVAAPASINSPGAEGYSANDEGVPFQPSATGGPSGETANDEGAGEAPEGDSKNGEGVGEQSASSTQNPEGESENSEGISSPADPEGNSENDEGLTSPPEQITAPQPEAESENGEESAVTFPSQINPTSNLPQGGGGGGIGNYGWSGGGSSVFSQQPAHLVTRNNEPVQFSTELPNICFMVDGYARPGRNNNPLHVAKVQSFLLAYEGADVRVTGGFDDATEQAINDFQRKHAADILLPWGTQIPTGYAYITTVKKMNEISCKILRDLTLEEKRIISEYRNGLVAGTRALEIPALEPAPGSESLSSPQADVGQKRPARAILTGNMFIAFFDGIRGFFGRLFGR